MTATDPRLAHTLPAADPVVSIVIPVRNEAANVAPLVAELRAALDAVPYEVVYVDDGSTDLTPDALRTAAADGDIRWFRHRVTCGQSAAIITGVFVARGDWIATLDGDGQNDPTDILPLFERAMNEQRMSRGPVLVAGHRVRRRDSLVKRLSSRAANAVRSRMLGDRTQDTGCGLKVFRRDAFLALPHFDHMHRFLPALFLRAGGRVVSVPVNHRPRITGRSNYGTFDRLWVGLFDLVGVIWLMRRWKQPQLETGGEALS